MSEATAATISEATAVLARSSRRAFLKTAAATAAGLTIGFHWSGPLSRALADTSKDFAPNAFLRIAPDNSVTVIAKHLEMGQGTYTGLATIVAEELDADWAQIRVESAPADASKYANLAFGTIQGTGGSSAMANSWMQLRNAGATARAMLVAAAAAEWNVPPASLTVERGVVRHAPSNRQATFGDLAAKAASQPVPDKVALKDPKDFKLIGQKLPRVDIPGKTNGTAQFTIDVTFPDMLVAVLQRPPLFGATVKSFDATATKAVPGVVEVVQVPRGVAVVAKSFWAAKHGRDALKVEWDDSKAEKRSTAAIMAEYRTLAEQPGKPARKEGDAAAALKGAAKLITATYEFPVSGARADGAARCGRETRRRQLRDLGGDQFQTVDQAQRGGDRGAQAGAGEDPHAARRRQLRPARQHGLRLHRRGGLGRQGARRQRHRRSSCSGRAKTTFAAGSIARFTSTGLRRRWTTNGQLVGWQHRIVGQSIIAGTAFAAVMVKDGIDGTSVEGAANLPYAIPNMSVELNTTETGVPVLWWRVVGSSHTAFATEAFIDEIASRRRQGSVRLPPGDARTSSAPQSRAGACGQGGRLGQPVAERQGPRHRRRRGVRHLCRAGRRSDGATNGKVKVDRVVCAVDCGTPINPDVITAQMEGGIGFGLGAALYGAITLKDGQVEQTNFDDYQVLRIDEMPKVEVHIVPSPEAPTGVGEPGVAPVGPAVANAVFAATGKRLRVLPFAVGGTV